MKIYENFKIVCDFMTVLKQVYEDNTHRSFFDLNKKVEYINANESACDKRVNIVDLAVLELIGDKLMTVDINNIEVLRAKEKQLFKIEDKYYVCNNANISHTMDSLNMDDIVNIWACLKFSQEGCLLLIHYDDIAIFNDNYFKTRSDVWNAYDGILAQCRSVVINTDDFTIASLPFYKFQNMNETEEYSQAAVETMLSTATTIEFADKLDGSMMQLRWYKDRFLMTSSSSLNPDRCFQLSDALAFANSHSKYVSLCRDYPDYTILCEWIAENDAHIVCYKEKDFGLSLIGMRNVNTGKLKTYKEVVEIANKYGLSCTTLYSETFESVLSKINLFSSAEKEGYVLNIDGFLVKIKCNDFVMMTKTIQECRNINNIVKCIVNGTVDDLIAKVPEQYKETILSTVQFICDFKNKFNELVDYYYQSVPINADRKTIMMFIDKNIPKYIRGYVRNKYLGVDFDILAKFKHTNNPRYISKTEIDSWLEIINDKIS